MPRYRRRAPRARKAIEAARTGPALPPVSVTTDSGLFLSTPVPASKPSLLHPGPVLSIINMTLNGVMPNELDAQRLLMLSMPYEWDANRLSKPH
jgi:hypothetical protein